MKTSKLLYLTISFFTLFLFVKSANATHVIGGEITYTCVGPNQYRVNLSLYRDCSGINLPTIVVVTVNGCTSQSVSLTQLAGYPIDITPLCPGQTSTCSGGTGSYGVEKSIYQGTLTLPGTCTNATLSYSICCRSTNITNLNSPGNTNFYVDATIDNSVTPCNSSPEFLHVPIMYACQNQGYYYDPLPDDPDDDSLAFSLINCHSNSANSVTYSSGFSSTNPLSTSSGVNIDPHTGIITFTPTTLEIGVICVLVEEFRNGTKLAETVRDLQVTVVSCANSSPHLTGIDSTSSYNVNFQAGVNNCFTIYSSDPDTGQVTSIFWDTTIVGASFITSGSPNEQAVFCWTPSLADTGTHTFVATVFDDGCPISAVQLVLYTVTVSALPNGTSLASSPKEMSFRLYPVPVKDEIQIDFYNATVEESQLAIVNFRGEVLQTTVVSPHTQNIRLDASGLSAGLHIALFRDKSGNVIASRKFVVQ